MLPNPTPDGAIRGHIYQITAPGCAKVYVRSTRLKLCQRMSQHRKNLRKWQRGRFHFISSYEVLAHPGAGIHILEEGQFTKQHMREREAHYIQSLPSVNRNVPGRSPAESRRVCAAKVACPTCGKRVRRDNLKKHALTRRCSLLASNAARPPQLVEALAGVGAV